MDFCQYHWMQKVILGLVVEDTGQGIEQVQQNNMVGKVQGQAHTTPTSKEKKNGIQSAKDENLHNNLSDTLQKPSNNKSKGKLSKKKRDAIKKKQQKENEIQGTSAQQEQVQMNKEQLQQAASSKVTTGPGFNECDVEQSEDEIDEDTQSLNEEGEGTDEDETSAHLIKAFGSTFQSEFQEEIEEVTNQQGLSPRGRKQMKLHNKQNSNNTSATSRRPNTRSRSRGF
uniref:Uncharacterized protein n=1 Tax=Solanum tuberosum TaxID=4113 RepID=M1DRJ2_SOLTU